MNKTTPPLQNTFLSCLEKSSYLTKREHDALWAILSTLIGSSHFSLSEVSRRFGKKVGRNLLSEVLRKYAFIQENIFRLILSEIISIIDNRKNIYLIIDDTLVEKTGKCLSGSCKWFDHSKMRQIHGYCLVNLALSVDGEVLLFLPWILSAQSKPTKNQKSNKKEQDKKNLAALGLIEIIEKWLVKLEVSKDRIFIEGDSWFSFAFFRKSLSERGLNYRIDSKSNYTVQQVDHEAINKAKEQVRGRKRKYFVKYVHFKEFLGDQSEWKSFLDTSNGARIRYNQAQVTLKSGGQVIVCAFWNEKYTNPKYILVNVKRKRRPTAKTIYRDYNYRWVIETAHQQLKQQFGLKKCQCRDQWIIKGFFFLVCFAYTLWKFEIYKLKLKDEIPVNCPTWSQNFHKEQILLIEGS